MVPVGWDRPAQPCHGLEFLATQTARQLRREKALNNFWIRRDGLPVRGFPGVSYGLVACTGGKMYVVMRDQMYECFRCDGHRQEDQFRRCRLLGHRDNIHRLSHRDGIKFDYFIDQLITEA